MMRAMRTVFVLSLALAGCSGGASNPQPQNDLATAPAADLAKAPPFDLAMSGDMAKAPVIGASVVMKDDFYMPNMVSIKTGESVKWTWQAAGTHGVDFMDAALTDSPLMNASNTTYLYTFPTAGTYTVNCAVHGQAMQMTVKVQ